MLKEIHLSEAPQPSPFNTKEQPLYSELLNPVSKAEPSRSAEETHFGCFNSWSHFLAHDRRLRMIVGQKLCIPARLPFFSLSISHSIFFFLPFLLNKPPESQTLCCWLSFQTEANVMASSAKFRDMVLRFPNWTLSSPQRRDGGNSGEAQHPIKSC